MTEAEREQLLDEAADKYMRGEITVEEFHQAQEQYGIDYSAALQALAAYLVTHKRQRQGVA